MTGINECLLDVYQPPKMISKSFNFNGTVNVSNMLRSRHTITISQDEMNELTKDKNFWLYESDAESYNELNSASKIYDDLMFENITDGFGISEYIGEYEKYFPSMEYLQYTMHNNLDIVMNIYDHYTSYAVQRKHPIIRDKMSKQLINMHNIDNSHKLPEFEFNIPDKIIYTKFIENKYEHNVVSPYFKNEFHMISINLPYEFYSRQILPPSIYTYDIESNSHKFGSYDVDEFNEILNDIVTNGIQTPLFMRLNGETISSIDNYTNIIIFIAKVLKLPTIPITLYLSNDDLAKNHLIDAILQNGANKFSLFKNYGFINKVLDPYILLTKPNTDIDIVLAKQFSVFSSNKNTVVRYRTSDKIIIVEDEKTEALHNEMQNKEIESINNTINSIISDLLK